VGFSAAVISYSAGHGLRAVVSNSISNALQKAVTVARELSQGVLPEHLPSLRAMRQTIDLLDEVMTDYLKRWPASLTRNRRRRFDGRGQAALEDDRFGNSLKKMILGFARVPGQDWQRRRSSGHGLVADCLPPAISRRKGSQTLSRSSERITSTIHDGSFNSQVATMPNAECRSRRHSASVTEMVSSLQGIAENTKRLPHSTGSTMMRQVGSTNSATG